MQSIDPVTPAQLLAAGQVPLMKVEIYVDAAWVDLSALDGKNYIEDVSISLGGASMTPDPVGGTWNATLLNKDSIFHPAHPTSAYKDYLKTGRKTRISVGATYAGEEYYWQRLIGYMSEPKFSAPDYKVSIGGGDYMKFLQDTKLKFPDNYWGPSATFSSFASDGLGDTEIYDEGDAMEIGAGEGDNVTPWTASGCTFVSVADTGGGSSYVGKMVSSSSSGYIKNINVGPAVAGKEYRVSFKFKNMGALPGFDNFKAAILQDDGGEAQLAVIDNLDADSYTKASFNFTALVTGPIIMKAWIWSVFPGSNEFRIDDISIREFTPYWERYYQLPVGCKGPFRVVLDGEDVWEGEGDEDWQYDKDAEPGPDPPAHPARIVSFNINKKVAKGTDNLVIYYFTVESPENAMARLLFKAGLYASEAAALADMEYTATGITIDKIWFKAGSKCLAAVKKICERCDYRFHFKWDGTPVFKPKPAPGSIAFTFTAQKHIAACSNYQARKEIKNRIVIEGMKQADPASKEETAPPELKGEAYDQTSIDAYGERTMTIRNHLFQDLASITNMCTSLLAEYKDPKWYSDVEVEYRPAPIEMGDKISWKGRLSPILEITQEGITRDIKIDSSSTIYKCVTT